MFFENLSFQKFPVIDMSKGKSTEEENIYWKYCLLCLWILKAYGQNPSIMGIIKGDKNWKEHDYFIFFSQEQFWKKLMLRVLTLAVKNVTRISMFL